MGYRDLCLNVEVGWTLQKGVVQFEAVQNWVDMECRTLICEIQGVFLYVAMMARIMRVPFCQKESSVMVHQGLKTSCDMYCMYARMCV